MSPKREVWVQAEWLYQYYVSKSIIIPKEFELQNYIKKKNQADRRGFPAFDTVLQLRQIQPWGWGWGTR